MKTYVGVDPGASGAIVALTPDGTIVYSEKFHDRGPKELYDIVHQVVQPLSHVCMELVTPSPPQDGPARRSGTLSMFNFGKNVGHLEVSVLTAVTDGRLRMVTPATWQKCFGLYGMGKMDRTTKKNIHKAKAIELFGTQGKAITHANADALLIAEYCRRTTPNG